MYTTTQLLVSVFTFVHIDILYIRGDTNYVRVYPTCPSHLESPLIESGEVCSSHAILQVFGEAVARRMNEVSPLR